MRIIFLNLLIIVNSIKLISQVDLEIENSLYSRILTEFIESKLNDEQIELVVIKKEPKKMILQLDLKHGSPYNLSELLAIDQNLLEIKGNIAIADTSLINLIKKYEKDTVRQLDISKLNLSYKSELISESQIISLFKNDLRLAWVEFHEKYQNAFGIIEFSNMTISDDRKKCLMYIGYRKGSLNGYGCLLYVGIENNRIMILKEIELWMS